MRTQSALLAALALAGLLPLYAQERTLYKVEIDIHDSSAAAGQADRRFTLLVDASKKAVFKVGSRTPTVSGSFQPATDGSMVGTEFTYLDTGVNIECTVHDVGGKVALHGSIDLSDIAPNESGPVAGVRNPTIKQTKLDLETTVSLAKPTVVASIDDPVTARQLRVEATITSAN